jgi:hypothetical protein
MANFQDLDNIYNEVNTIIDELLEVHSKLDKREKQNYNLHLQICELEKQLTQINILRLDKIKEMRDSICLVGEGYAVASCETFINNTY